MMQKGQYRRIRKQLAIILLFSVLSGLFLSIDASAVITTETHNFESTSRTQYHTVTFTAGLQVKEVTVNTGNVTYSVNGNQINLTLTNGTITYTGTPQQQVSITQTSSVNSFPSSIPYSAGGYSGTLYKVGSSYVYSGSPAGSKTATGTLNSTSWIKYQWNGSNWVMIDSYSPNNPTIPYGPDAEGFSGTLYKTGYALIDESGSPPSNPYVGQTYVLYRYWIGYYSGTVTKPDTRIYGQNYAGTVYGPPATYYQYTVTVKTGPENELLYWEANADITNQIGRWDGSPSVYIESQLGGGQGTNAVATGMSLWNSALGLSMTIASSEDSADIKFYVASRDVLLQIHDWLLYDNSSGMTDNTDKQLIGYYYKDNIEKLGYQMEKDYNVIYSCIVIIPGTTDLQYQKIGAHEMGHVLGWFGHIAESGNIMATGSFGIIPLSEREIRHLKQFYDMA